MASPTSATAPQHDERGGYELESIPTPPGFDIATYLWTPACGLSAASGVVFLLHGIMYHSTFEWLAPDADNYRNTLDGSVIDRLMALGLVVVAHDHPGHGRSSGLRVHFREMDDLFHAFSTVVRHFSDRPELIGKKKFAIGMSLGALTALRTACLYPDLIDAHILLSPPFAQPATMSPWYARFLRACVAPLSLLTPSLQIMWLPRNPHPVTSDAVEKDALIAHVAVRARVAAEFFRMFDLFLQENELPGNSILVAIGAKDVGISRSTTDDFVSRFVTEDKNIFVNEEGGHDLFREDGGELSIQYCLDWIKARLL